MSQSLTALPAHLFQSFYASTGDLVPAIGGLTLTGKALAKQVGHFDKEGATTRAPM